MSSLLTTILQHTQPDYWDYADYRNARFKSFPLSKFSNEYVQIQAEFIGKFGSGYDITEISRIQHGYAYTSCQVRRKQLSIINGTGIPSVKRKYFILENVGQVNEFLEFNCDDRKGRCVTYCNVIPSSGCVVMAKEIDDGNNSYKSRSSNGYPDYLIKCELDLDSFGSSFGRLALR